MKSPVFGYSACTRSRNFFLNSAVCAPPWINPCSIFSCPRRYAGSSTNFFSVMSGTVAAPLGEDGTPLFEDSESILEEFAGSGAPMTRLKWHYRSAHESLINFSNVNFYDSDLYTFPSVETDSQRAGLSFEYVADGVYEGKGLNMAEARRVADAVVRFAKEQAARRGRGEPELSLGVGTFNLRQQLAVQDELEVRRRQDPTVEPFFARGRPETVRCWNWSST